MSTADAAGTAGTATPLAGPPLADSQVAGLALFEVAAAQDRRDRAKAALVKVRAMLENAEADAEARVEAAQAELDAEVERATELTGINPGRLVDLAVSLAEEQARHEQELAALLAGEG